jgi:hypothetical protein
MMFYFYKKFDQEKYLQKLEKLNQMLIIWSPKYHTIDSMRYEPMSFHCQR